MFLNLPRDVIRSSARFRLRVHTLRFETVTWNESNSPTCDLCDNDDERKSKRKTTQAVKATPHII
jgi:hypothetical protein